MKNVTLVISDPHMVDIHLGDSLLGGRITTLSSGDHSYLLEALQDSIMALEIVYPNGSPVLNAARAAIARARGES